MNHLARCLPKSARPALVVDGTNAHAMGLEFVVLHLSEASWDVHEPTIGPIVE